MSDWIQVYSAADSLEAHSLKGLLETAGIEVRLKGESLYSGMGELPATVLEVTLWVEDIQLSKATQLLAEYEDSSAQPWYCSGCGELNESNFEICWNCQKERNSSKLF